MFRQLLVATLTGMKQYLRNSLFIVLLVILPPTFITLSFAVTPDVAFAVIVPEGGANVEQEVGMVNLHGAVMVPITVSFLAGILGLFLMLSCREPDRRLVNAGYSPRLLLLVRLGILGLISLFITALSVAVTLVDYEPEQLGLFFLINFVSALQYAFIGALVGTFLSAMSGTYLMFFLPMIDVGVLQNPMFVRDGVEWWMKALPGFAPMEVLLDVSFTQGFDSSAELGMALGYLVALAAVVTLFFWMATGRAGFTPAVESPAVGDR